MPPRSNPSRPRSNSSILARVCHLPPAELAALLLSPSPSTALQPLRHTPELLRSASQHLRGRWSSSRPSHARLEPRRGSPSGGGSANRGGGRAMGKYCTAAAVAAEGEQPVAVFVPPPPTRYLYGNYDRCSIKQVFDNLHGNISLDLVRQHRRVDGEGGDRGGKRRELVAAGLDGTALVSGDRGGC